VTVLSRLGLTAAAVLLAVQAGLAQSAPQRIVAIGDIHGAYGPLVTILTKAGLIDAQQKWIGGRATLVQTGDYTDRGAQVRQVLDFLIALEQSARSGGGQAQILLGNHEVMNIIGDVRDVTPEIFATFADGQSEGRREAAWKQYEALVEGRRKVRTTLPKAYEHTRESWMAAHPPGWLEYREALGPRGRYGRWLRGKPIAASIGGTIFMHAGISPDQAITVDIANTRARDEMARFEKYVQQLVDRKMVLPFFTFQEVLEVGASEVQAAGTIIEAAKAKNEQPDLSTFDVAILREAFDMLKIDQWAILAAEGPLWFRGYANWPEDEASRAKVSAFLDQQGVQRIAVAHTPQRDGRIAARFQGRVFVIDTGMLAEVYKGRPSALEIRGAVVNAIYEDGVVPLSSPSARANNPVALATAKLAPLRLRSGGTPGIGRGKPAA
jgi:calcineurin-like phosphoesterase family protein